jgi:hypothetical protein
MLKTNDFFVEVCSEAVFDGDAQQYERHERDLEVEAAEQVVADVNLFGAPRTPAFYAAKRLLADEAARMRTLVGVVARALKKGAIAGSTPAKRQGTSSPVSGQTAAAQHTSTGGSEDGDPDPADRIIPDPCKTDPRILAYGDTPTARANRKAIMAIRMGVRHPAADYYVQRALAEMVKQVKYRVRCMPFRIHTDLAAPLILDAALSLLYGLAAKHVFRDLPNPNFYNIVQRNIQLPANLREVANRLRKSKKEAENGKKGGQDADAGSRQLDILDVEAGLARRPAATILPQAVAHPDPGVRRKLPAGTSADYKAYCEAEWWIAEAGTRPGGVTVLPAITSAALRAQARKMQQGMDFADRVKPTIEAEDGLHDSFDGTSMLAARDVQDDPFLSAWTQELVAAGQRPDFDDDPDGAISAAVAAKGGVGAAFGTVEAVLEMVAALSAEDCRDRAGAIFGALDFLDGCGSVQHRTGKLLTCALNAQGKTPEPMRRAATTVLLTCAQDARWKGAKPLQRAAALLKGAGFLA